jgi:serine protease Do
MIENIALSEIGAELASMADRLRSITVRVRNGNLGIGAGTIWGTDGLIITNAHVATRARFSFREATPTIVELADGRVFSAIRTHFDPQQDLAALQITATDLTAAEIGDVDKLRVGGLVMAVGNPLDDPGAVTTGTLYAKQSSSLIADVRLYPGNSGGPLADCLGRVVGINTMIVDGLAVAIPISKVVAFLRGRDRRVPGLV